MIEYSIDAEFALKLLIGFISGITVGIERVSADVSDEGSRKYGPRTASLLSIMGVISAYFSFYSPYVILAGIIVLGIIEYHYLRFRFEREP